VFCYDKEGIAYSLFNQKYDEDSGFKLLKNITNILDGWLPYTTNYKELQEKGWNTNYTESNEYVKEYITNDDCPYTKQYHDAWSRLDNTKKQALWDYIKSQDWLPADRLETFTKITGIKLDNGGVENPKEIIFNNCKYIRSD